MITKTLAKYSHAMIEKDVKTFHAGTQSRDERHCDHSLHGTFLSCITPAELTKVFNKQINWLPYHLILNIFSGTALCNKKNIKGQDKRIFTSSHTLSVFQT